MHTSKVVMLDSLAFRGYDSALIPRASKCVVRCSLLALFLLGQQYQTIPASLKRCSILQTIELMMSCEASHAFAVEFVPRCDFSSSAGTRFGVPTSSS